jgi:hypothetical protein
MEHKMVGRGSVWRRGMLLLIVMGAWFCMEAEPAFGAGAAGPCSLNSDGRQLDYWLGEWMVRYPGMQGSGTSKVYLSLDQCMLVESWDSGAGLKGENVFAYNAEDKSWHGLYLDNHGRVHVFEGKVTPGSAEFDGPSRGPNGDVVLNRVKVVRVSANTIEQSWEKSADNGATWKTEFRGEYSRKGP